MSQRGPFRVGFLQFAPQFGAVEDNIAAVVSRLAAVEADLMVLPELCASGYQFISKREAAELAEEIPTGPASRALAELARDRGLWLVAGLAERYRGRVYNSAALFGPRGHRATYRKAHLFFEEKRWFTPGNGRFAAYDIGRARVGLMVCFDWFFPEAARSLALAGADVIAHPSNLVLPYGPDAMVTRCLENRVFAVTANRTGTEARGGKPPLTYIGSSEVVAPDGRILVRAGRAEDSMQVVEIDPRAARRKRINRYNDLFADRRVELYARQPRGR